MTEGPIDLAARRERAWNKGLLVTKSKEPKRCLANVLHVLSAHPDWSGVLAWDEFGQAVVTRRVPPMRPQDAPGSYSLGDWSDEDTTRTAAWFASTIGFEPSTGMVNDGVQAAARRTVVHQVRDWLGSLTWDGTPRIDAFVANYLGGARSAYSAAVGRRWLISAVARVFAPGCKVDSMLVLEGVQGIGKSSALRLLAGAEWFADTGVVLGEKDSLQALRRKWLYEFAELASIRGREVERIKAFVSSQTDTYRPSYGRRTQDYPRQVVFAGSTNDAEYLADPSGARRFWPIRCSAIDLEALGRDREQLWAEARAAYKAGEPWHIDSEDLRRLAAQEAAERTEQDAWLPIVAKWLEEPTVPDPVHRDHRERVNLEVGFTTADVALGALGFTAARIGRGDATRIGKVLHGLGYHSRDSRQERHGVTRVRLYFKVVTGSGDAFEAENSSSHNVTTTSDDTHIHKSNLQKGVGGKPSRDGCDVVTGEPEERRKEPF